MTSTVSRELLTQLADAYGVATEYWGYSGDLVAASDETLLAVLRAMGVEATSEEAAQFELAGRRDKDWRQILPTCPVIRNDRESFIQVHVPHGWSAELDILLEDGGVVALSQADDFTEPRTIEGHLIGQASFRIEPGLPLGYHELRARVDAPGHGHAHEELTTLVCAPTRLPDGKLADGRSWGMMAQLYSVRSRQSWGIGDLADLKEMGSLFGDLGADFVLINPLHAAEPVGHMAPSPYLPVTRRFFNPIYIRPEDIREVAYLTGPQRSLVTWAGENVKKTSVKNEYLDRDAAWSAKREGLEVIFAAGRSEARQRDFERFREMEGQGLEDFALWCALTEKYGDSFPENLKDIASPYVARERRELAGRIEFWAWLQWIMDEQLANAQASAVNTGMEFGICHDLAVGVHPKGSDVWTIPGAFAKGVGVGAPPDMFNQLGQNWSQPPWRPDALEKMDYSPLRDMARTVLRHAGALRVDHILGLFRLWWIPEGMTPDKGTYVRFNHEAMVGILLLEAYRANAVVIGEDLGNVEPWVRGYLAERGILGTSVFWFEKDHEGNPLQPHDYRTEVLVTVDNHDLPPAAGYLAEEHVDLRSRLGLLTETDAEARAFTRDERERSINRLREHGLIGDDPSEREIIEAMHVYIARTPAKMLAVNLVDAVGERRIQNQPGTDQEYPNWRVPLADGTEQVVLVEDLSTNPRMRSLVDAFTAALEN